MAHSEMFDFVHSAFVDSAFVDSALVGIWPSKVVVGRDWLIQRHSYTGK